MRTIGMLGGMSWESTLSYYKAINQGIKARLGGLHSARISLYSIDFGEIETLQQAGKWEQIAQYLVQAALCVEAGGADFLLICTNTMHKVATDIEAALSIPLVHIADATAEQILARGLNKIGLLGTRFTMEERFYKGRMSEKYGLEVMVPEADDRDFIHQVIFNELCQGKVLDVSRRRHLDIINRLREKGAQAVILGCTEIGLLVDQSHTTVPLFDTTAIHAAKAVELALAE